MSKLGEFTQGGKAFRINTPKTPERWYNLLFNDSYLADVSQTLQGKSAFFNDYNQNDYTAGYRHFYLLDRDSKEVFCPCYAPLKTEFDSFFCEHHLGFSLINAEKDGLKTSIRVFVPAEGEVEIWTISIENKSSSVKNLSLFSVIPFENSDPMGGEARFLKDEGFLYKYSFPYHVFYEDKEKVENDKAYFFMFSDLPVDSYDGSSLRFYGSPDITEIPEAVKNGCCSNIDGDGEKDFVGAFEHKINLKPGAVQTVNIVIGVSRSLNQIRENKKRFDTPARITDAFNEVYRIWDERCESYHIETPDNDFNYLINYWIKKQVILLTRLNRMSVYCPVRNQLQDALGYSLIDPQHALEFALAVLRRQNKNGFLQQWYMTDGSSPKPLCFLKHGDAGLWLVMCMIEIIDKCGDFSIYDRMEKYIDSEDNSSIYDHLLKAAFYQADNIGEHGLCLMLDGDWTDPINGAGRFGRGESTWSSMALLYCLKQLIAVADKRADTENSQKLHKYAQNIDNAINTYCWDGKWYVAGLDDNGIPFGRESDEEAKLFLNAQTWAVISGAAKDERLELVKKAIDQLETPFGSLLFIPEFTRWNETWGRISVKQKGTTENGSVYCHGTMFKAYADVLSGDGDRAYSAIVKTLPTNPQNPPEKSLQVPLFVPNYYFGLSSVPNFGRSSCHYGTGTAAWLIWVALEHITGVRATCDGIKVKPCLPKGWGSIKVNRRFRGEIHSFEVSAHK